VTTSRVGASIWGDLLMPGNAGLFAAYSVLGENVVSELGAMT
jgi:hypothetical protein